MHRFTPAPQITALMADRTPALPSVPSDLLKRWIERVPPGPALDLGAGYGMTSHWLAENGFQVDAVEVDPERFRTLATSCQHGNPRPHHADIAHFEMPREHYTLVLAQAVLHFLTPEQIDRVAPRIIDTLLPGGFLIAEVLTTDDPQHEALRRGGAGEMGPHTFNLPESDGVIKFFEPGELKAHFSPLELLEYDLARRIAPEAQAGYRAGAALVARKPAPTPKYSTT